MMCFARAGAGMEKEATLLDRHPIMVIIKVDADSPEEGAISRAAAVIRDGGLVAFPTETVYGLGADATSERAVRKIFEAKGRPADNPIIVHVGDRGMVAAVADDLSPQAEKLIERFWPGPLTLVVNRKAEVAPSVSAGLQTVGVRMPQNKVALELIRRALVPIAAPSANRSGRPSPTEAAHVSSDLGGRVDIILDGGATNIGIESTVLDVTSDPPLILRPGWVTREALAEVIGRVRQAASDDHLKRSPGTRHRHYSPRAPVVLVERASPQFIRQLCERYLDRGPVGFIGHTAVASSDPRLIAVILPESAEGYARSIYGALRRLDEAAPVVIVVEGINQRGRGAAVMDRLRRAAAEVITGE